jgi:hypothetical protein
VTPSNCKGESRSWRASSRRHLALSSEACGACTLAKRADSQAGDVWDEIPSWRNSSEAFKDDDSSLLVLLLLLLLLLLASVVGDASASASASTSIVVLAVLPVVAVTVVLAVLPVAV